MTYDILWPYPGMDQQFSPHSNDPLEVKPAPYAGVPPEGLFSDIPKEAMVHFLSYQKKRQLFTLDQPYIAIYLAAVGRALQLPLLSTRRI